MMNSRKRRTQYTGMYFEYVKPVSVFIGRHQHETGLIEVQRHDSLTVGRKMSDNIGSLRRTIF